jgi:hypothetical protein
VVTNGREGATTEKVIGFALLEFELVGGNGRNQTEKGHQEERDEGLRWCQVSIGGLKWTGRC